MRRFSATAAGSLQVPSTAGDQFGPVMASAWEQSLTGPQNG